MQIIIPNIIYKKFHLAFKTEFLKFLTPKARDDVKDNEHKLWFEKVPNSLKKTVLAAEFSPVNISPKYFYNKNREAENGKNPAIKDDIFICACEKFLKLRHPPQLHWWLDLKPNQQSEVLLQIFLESYDPVRFLEFPQLKVFDRLSGKFVLKVDEPYHYDSSLEKNEMVILQKEDTYSKNSNVNYELQEARRRVIAYFKLLDKKDFNSAKQMWLVPSVFMGRESHYYFIANAIHPDMIRLGAHKPVNEISKLPDDLEVMIQFLNIDSPLSASAIVTYAEFFYSYTSSALLFLQSAYVSETKKFSAIIENLVQQAKAAGYDSEAVDALYISELMQYPITKHFFNLYKSPSASFEECPEPNSFLFSKELSYMHRAKFVKLKYMEGQWMIYSIDDVPSSSKHLKYIYYSQ